MADRVFLFLQSHPSFIGRSLINQMRSQGVECHIVNLSLSDWLSRLGLGAKNYMGKLENWRDYLRNFIECNAITDIVYYQDQRPYHRIARSLAHEMKLNTYVYEFGYFRPDWVTLEKGGMGPFSHFPNNPEQIMRLASKLDERVYSTHYPYPFFAEAFFEVVYHMMPRGFPFVFRHYKNDRYYHPWFDFPSYIPRLLRSKSLEISAQQTIDSLVADETEFFVIPMQLQSDYQIRRASHYGHMSEMVEEVISSFKKNANKDAALVFKVHPLDNNIERWPRAIAKIAESHGMQNRVKIIDGGDLFKLVRNAAGVVLINSTTGISVLEHDIPLKVLGIAVFDIEGLTHQGPLHDFWKNPKKPDKELTQALFKLLKASVQLKGNFFTKSGKKVAASEMARRLIEDDVNSYGAFVSPPPRLELAKQRNVPMVFEDLEY